VLVLVLVLVSVLELQTEQQQPAHNSQGKLPPPPFSHKSQTTTHPTPYP
jgi:hypothetical protein